MPYSFSINRYASISEWNSGDEITTNFVISFQLFYAYSSYLLHDDYDEQRYYYFTSMLCYTNLCKHLPRANTITACTNVKHVLTM